MVHQSIMIDVLFLANDCNPVQMTFNPFALVIKIQVVSCEVSAKAEAKTNWRGGFEFLTLISHSICRVFECLWTSFVVFLIAIPTAGR